MKRLTFFAVAFLIGALSALGFAPFSFPPALLAGYAWLFVKLENDSRAQAFWRSYAFGFGQFLAGLYWIGNSTLVDPETWWWFWPFAAIGLPLVVALYPAIAGWLTARLPFPRLPAAMILFSLAEFARAYFFTGFPWNLSGNTWISLPWIAQNADWAGLYGLGCITLLLSALLAAFFLYRYSMQAVCLFIVILCVMTVYGGLARQDTIYDDNVSVRIVQPNIPQKIKWADGHIFANSLAPLALSDAPPNKPAQENWLIWPETAQASPIWRSGEFRKFYKASLADWPANTTVYTGYLSLDPARYANSLIAADKEGKIIWRQDKHHLVPFGEYMPLDEILNIGPVVGMEGFVFGMRPSSKVDGIIPLICYEIIFPRYARQAKTSETRAIMTVTDDSWFGFSSGPFQHLVQAQFRAIETGLPVLRAANTGISAIIDPYGRVLQRIKLEEPGVMDSALPERRKGDTFYARHGDRFAFLYFLFGVFVLLLGKRFSFSN